MKTYEVEKIVDFEIINNEKMYKIKWKGYSIDQSSWVPASNLYNFKKEMKEAE